MRLYKDHSETEAGEMRIIAEEMKLGGGIKANAKQKSYANSKGGANKLIQLPNGALVISYEDRSIEIWEEKRKKKGKNACACCTIF